MKKVFFALALFLGVGAISSCSKGVCMDCSAVAGGLYPDICEKDYNETTTGVTWADYQAALEAAGCVEK